MVTLRVEKDCAEKHIRDVEKIGESFLKERNGLLECSDKKRVQKEVEIVKLNEKVTKLEEGVATFMAGKGHAETDFKQVKKSMLEERDKFKD